MKGKEKREKKDEDGNKSRVINLIGEIFSALVGLAIATACSSFCNIFQRTNTLITITRHVQRSVVSLLSLIRDIFQRRDNP